MTTQLRFELTGTAHWITNESRIQGEGFVDFTTSKWHIPPNTMFSLATIPTDPLKWEKCPEAQANRFRNNSSGDGFQLLVTFGSIAGEISERLGSCQAIFDPRYLGVIQRQNGSRGEAEAELCGKRAG